MAPKRWAALILKCLGWRLDLPVPPGPKMLLLMYPHTSNWDFVLGMLGCFACGWPVRWIGKCSIFRPPFGGMFRWLGGIPVDRKRPGGFIADIVEHCQAVDHAVIVIAPEGTRAYVDEWKSGFHRIARAAGLPIGLGYLDYRIRRIGIAGYVEASEDVAADMERIRAAYADVTARHPRQVGPVTMR